MSRIEPKPVVTRILGYRAEQVRAFIERQVREHGISPSYAEIKDALGLCSKGDVHRIIVGLESRNLVARDVNRWGRKGVRVIRLVR